MIAGAVEVIIHDEKSYPGRIRMSEIPDYTTETLHDFVKSEVADGSTVKTDGLPSYNNLVGTDHDKQVVGDQLAHNVLPWIHRIFANFKAWEIGVYHGLSSTLYKICSRPRPENLVCGDFVQSFLEG